MNFIINFFLFFIGLFVKMFSYTLLTFLFVLFGIIFLAYIYLGSDITFIIEKFHETIPQSILI